MLSGHTARVPWGRWKPDTIAIFYESLHKHTQIVQLANTQTASTF